MPNSIKVCSFDGCGRKLAGRGLCNGHYKQLRLRGSQLTPLGRKSATAGMMPRERFEYYVDRSADCHIWVGTVLVSGYGHLGVAGKSRLAHRLAYEWAYGPIPKGLQVDHRCHTRTCVNPAHLRTVTVKQNQENLSGVTVRNQSGYRGVTFYPRSNKWHAQVTHDGKSYHLGYFYDVHEAGAAALAKRMELFTHSDGR